MFVFSVRRSREVKLLVQSCHLASRAQGFAQTALSRRTRMGDRTPPFMTGRVLLAAIVACNGYITGLLQLHEELESRCKICSSSEGIG